VITIMALATAARDAERVEILGVGVDCVDMGLAMARIEEFIRSKQPHLVATADSSGLVIAQSDPEFMAILKKADLVTPDSAGILWAAKRKGRKLKERVSGVDIVARLCARSADAGYRIFLLGSAPGVAETAAEKLRLRFPGCNIVGARHGYFPADSDAVVAAEVAEAKPDVLFVAMGIPRQEKFIAATMEIIRAPVAMGVGGSLDVFSGKAKRAPKIIQKLCLEWLWRVLLNPKKFGKVKTLPKFAWLVLREGR
jgi:N-acetylglucosaminyldiphosphoundecaprenol N-acetyl-beta-D-mannosaminyltransferase